MQTDDFFNARKTDFYDANGAKTEVLTKTRFDVAGRQLAIKFHEWMRENGWKLIAANNKDSAYVNSYEHEIYIHGSEYHFQKLINEHGHQINELFDMFNCAQAKTEAKPVL